MKNLTKNYFAQNPFFSSQQKAVLTLSPSNDTQNVEKGCEEDENITTYHNPPTFILQTLYFLIKLEA